MRQFKLMAILFLAAIAFSCNDDNDFVGSQEGNPNDSTIVDPGNGSEQENIDISDNFGPEIQDDFFGRVIDKDKNPLTGVQIKIGSKQATTDQNGVFKINGADVHEDYAYVKATKAGYVNASRALIPVEGTNNVKIMMLTEEVDATINSGEASSVSFDDGSEVEFSGDFITENGEAYSGSVDVIAHHLNPNDDDFYQKMPGMLYGANEDNEERMMQTFGQMSVELRGENGEDLNLAADSPATLHFPLDQNLEAEAASTIKLWYFDEDKGYWIMQGEASLENGEYVGEVKHFSFWNCDVPVEAVEINFNVENQNGDALNDVKLDIESDTYGTTYGITNGYGQVAGLVPNGEALGLKIYAFPFSQSETIVYDESIGPFSSDEDVTITVDYSNTPSIENTSITGTLQTCDNNNVSNGYATVIYQGVKSYQSVENGEYDMTISYLNNNLDFTFEGIDIQNEQTSGELNYTLNPDQTSLGIINACEDVDEFISYQIDDGQEEDVFIATGINVVTDSTMYDFEINSFQSGGACFGVSAKLTDDPEEGVYGYADVESSNPGFRFFECPSINADSSTPIEFNLTNFGEAGEYINFTFNGNYDDYNGTNHTISGTVHVKRVN